MMLSVVVAGRRIALGVLLVAATLVAAPASHADILTVSRTDDPSPDGCSPGECSLREAVIAANDEDGRDVIRLGEGTYELELPGAEDASATGDIDITSDVIVEGVGKGRTTVAQLLDERVVHVLPGGRLTLRDLAIVDGHAGADSGGGIFNEGTLVLRDVLVRDNVTNADGGGIANDGSLLLVDSRIVNNHATEDPPGFERGGGVFNDGLNALGRATVIRSTIAGNTSTTVGGGIFDQGGTLRVVSSTISGNASGGAGGIRSSGELVVRSSTIRANTVDQAGGGIQSFGDLRMVDSTVSGNSAAGRGGGIESTTSSEELAVLNRVTVTENIADSDGDNDGGGGGIRVGGALGESQLKLRASIVSGNTDASEGGIQVHDCSGPTGDPPAYVSLGFNIVGDGQFAEGCFPDPDPTDENIVDLPLGPLTDNGGPTWTHRLPPGSTAVDQMGAEVAGCGGADQRGAPRPYGPGCDAGAYELTQCRGRTVNVVGTPGDDRLEGTAGPDGVLALAGDDVIATFGGADCILAGPGDDRVDAGGGPDVVFGQEGDDVVFGRAAADELFGHAGDDTLVGGPQTDTCIGGPGANTLIGCP